MPHQPEPTANASGKNSCEKASFSSLPAYFAIVNQETLDWTRQKPKGIGVAIASAPFPAASAG
jgi:hypothetical protein